MLADVDLDVPEGTLTAILGASGSGKTTLLRVVMGFVAADRGIVIVGGRVVADAGRVHVPPDKRAIGYVAQEGALFPHLTVAENVGFGLPRSERRRGSRIDEALDLVGLDRGYARRQPQPAVRRRAAARGAGPRPRAAPGGRTARRAVLGARRRAARRDARRCARGDGGLRARPRSSSRTTRPRRSRWATRSRSSAPDGSSRRRRRPSSTAPLPTSTWHGSSARRSCFRGRRSRAGRRAPRHAACSRRRRRRGACE